MSRIAGLCGDHQTGRSSVGPSGPSQRWDFLQWQLSHQKNSRWLLSTSWDILMILIHGNYTTWVFVGNYMIINDYYDYKKDFSMNLVEILYVSIFEATIELGWGYSKKPLLFCCFKAQQDAEALWCHRYVNSHGPAVTGRRGQKKYRDLGSDQAATAGIADWSLVSSFTKFETKQSRWCLMNHCDLFCYRTLAKIAPVVFSCNDVAPRFKTCITSLCGTAMILGTGNMNSYQVRHRTVRKGGSIKYCVYIYIYVHT